MTDGLGRLKLLDLASIDEWTELSLAVVAHFDRVPFRPIAPADLYIDSGSENEQVQRHRVADLSATPL